jgi:hypothetical protein
MLQTFEEDATHVTVTREGNAVSEFIHHYFGNLNQALEWKAIVHRADRTHVHGIYELRYAGRRVIDATLKTHFHRDGFLQYASSSLVQDFTVAPVTELDASEVRRRVATELADRRGAFDGELSLEPVIWVAPGTNRGRPAFEVQVAWPRRGRYFIWIVAAESGAPLAERSTMAWLDVANRRVYESNPSAGLGSVSLTGLQDLVSLQNGQIHVRREEVGASVLSPVLKEVDPTLDYPDPGVTGGASYPFSVSPDDYRGEICAASAVPASSTCPNQSFDAVNIYYHLTRFRGGLDTTFGTLGIDSTGYFNDPLEVVVNSLGVDYNQDGITGNEVNNAAYVSSLCRSTLSPNFFRCLVFFRPAVQATTSCSADGSPQSVAFFDIARESNTIVHEYQHYVTDRLSRLERGSPTAPLVADALHEGFSDYFGASYAGGSDGTTIGKYVFQNCDKLKRDVTKLFPFTNTSNDPHVAGLTWASGLWRLHEEWGAVTADALAIKSLLFLPTRPTFLSAVESLVKADISLHDGAHVARIRQLFYDELKFVGGESGLFRNTSEGAFELGFNSCAATHGRSLEGQPWTTLLLFGLWLVGLLRLGEWWTSRTS